MSKLKHTSETYAIETSDDSNDCVIRAIATAGCLPYGEVSGLAFYLGRQRYRGTPTYMITDMIKKLFPDAIHMVPRKVTGGSWLVKVARPTLKQFAEEHPTGHYVLVTKSHAFALCDGVVHDWNLHSRYRIETAYKLC